MILGICPVSAQCSSRPWFRFWGLILLFLAFLLVSLETSNYPLPSAYAEDQSLPEGDRSPRKPKAPPKPTPTPQAKKVPTQEEMEKQEWIRHWCKRAKKDPKCRFYAEKELGQAMRDADKADKAMGIEEYCNLNKDDIQCQARKDRLELEEQRRKQKELMSYCRENPDAKRCAEAFGLTDVPD